MGLFCENIRIKIGHYLNGLNKIKETTIENRTPSEVKSILILSDVAIPNSQQGISVLKKGLKEMCPKTDFTIIQFNSKKNGEGETMISDTNKEFVSEEDFSFFFKIKNQTVKNYLANQYDIVVLLTTTKQLYVDFMMKYTRGNLLIGKRDLSDKLNFIVDSEIDNIKLLAETINMTYKMMFIGFK